MLEGRGVQRIVGPEGWHISWIFTGTQGAIWAAND
jgi:hypothetical protein